VALGAHATSALHSGGEVLFNLLADRYERRSTILTTNWQAQGTTTSRWVAEP